MQKKYMCTPQNGDSSMCACRSGPSGSNSVKSVKSRQISDPPRAPTDPPLLRDHRSVYLLGAIAVILQHPGRDGARGRFAPRVAKALRAACFRSCAE